jgi:NADPH:quinone reductase-like Zn-dependent oxidoreductase
MGTVTMEKERNPDTPKTPTAGAWWALLDDAPFDERENIPSPTSPMHSANSQWGSGFWSLLIAESPSNELEVSSFADKPSSSSRDHVKMTKNQATPLIREMKHKSTTNVEDAKPSFLQLLQCGSLDTSTFLKIEEEITERLDKVESPCKMLSRPDNEVFDEYDYEFCELNSESEDSGVAQKTQKDSFDDNMFNELQEEIPFLRERSEVLKASSKYKDILCAATLEVEHSKEECPSNNPDEMEITVKPLTTRKFPVQNTIDQLNENVPEAPATPTYREVRKGSPDEGSPTKTMKTARTENTSKTPEINAPPELVVINKDDGPPLSVEPPSDDVDAVGAEAIVKIMSTLTTEGEISTIQLESNNDLLPHQDTSTKMCMPPLLMKKLTTLKNIKLSRSMSSAQSIKTAAFHALNLHSTAEFSDNGETDDFVYEYSCKNHTYIAYFRRGTKAVHSIRLYEHPLPTMFPTLEDEVVVKIEASTVSTTDLQIRRGDFWGENSEHALNLPIVPGVAFAGKVHQTTQSGYRTGLNVGDRVTSLVQVGANSRHLCISSKHLVKVPDELRDPCIVACIPEIYLTAFQALHMGQKNGARYRKTSLAGKCILVLGGATVLGRALIEVAVAAGCGTVYATGKEKQFDAITQVGGAPLGRDPRQWRSTLVRKVDLVVGIDNSVGASELKDEHIELLARNGRVILLCGPNSEDKTPLDLDELAELSKTGKKLYHYNVFDAWEADLKQGKRDLTHLLKLLADGSIRPKILERIPLNKVAKAQDLMEGKKLNGFILCEPWIKSNKKKGEVTDCNVYAESASKSSSTVDKAEGYGETKYEPTNITVPADGAVVDEPIVPNSPKEIAI